VLHANGFCASQPYVASIMSQNIAASITSQNIDASITSSTNWCRVWLEDFFLRCILQSSLFLFSHLFIRVFGAQRNIHGTESYDQVTLTTSGPSKLIARNLSNQHSLFEGEQSIASLPNAPRRDQAAASSWGIPQS